MAVKTVKARWVAPFEAELPGVPVLIPGETVVEIPEEEANASDHWAIVGKGSKGPTVKELREQAESLGIEVPKGAKKPAIEKLIAKAQTEPPAEETPVVVPEQVETTEGADS